MQLHVVLPLKVYSNGAIGNGFLSWRKKFEGSFKFNVAIIFYNASADNNNNTSVNVQIPNTTSLDGSIFVVYHLRLTRFELYIYI